MEMTEFEPLNRILAKVRNSALTNKNGQDLHQKKNVQQEKQVCCDLCNDTGFIMIIRPDSQPLMKPCKCRELEKAAAQWRRSGININDLDKEFKNFEPWNKMVKVMKDRATSYYLRFDNIKATRRNSILFCGNPGCGKTHLSLALANKLLKEKKINVVYMQYRDTLTNLKRNMLDEEFYKKTLGKYQIAEVLLIDDLFKGKINETDINIMFELINYRYLNHLPIIVSTEFTVEKLLSFDEAIGSRIYEMCKDFITEIEGQENNYRLR